MRSHLHSPLHGSITTPSDLKAFGITAILQYIKALEAENKFWRERNEDVVARVVRLAAYGEACERRIAGGDGVIEDEEMQRGDESLFGGEFEGKDGGEDEIMAQRDGEEGKGEKDSLFGSF